MAFLSSLATALPEHVVEPDALKGFLRLLFADVSDGKLDEMDRLVESTRIERRHTVRPLDDYLQARTFEQMTEDYTRTTVELGRRALEEALGKAGVGVRDIDALVVTTATGFLIPSVDVYLVNEMGMRLGTKRWAFHSLGCGGGAGGVSRAADVVAGLGREAVVALVCVETPSLTFRPRDQSMQNVISALLFGDGAAAAVLCGRRPQGPSLRVIGSRSMLQPRSYHAMGFRVAADGFQVILSPEVPDRAPQGLAALVAELCGEANATPSDLSFFAIHPGGRKVLENVQEALRLDPEKTASAWRVLARHGNMSSPTALFVLEEELKRASPAPGALGLLCGFGPGFAVELALLRAEGEEGG